MLQDNPWQKQCLDNIHKIPNGVPCDDLRCSEVLPYMHAVCNCLPPYQNGCAGLQPAAPLLHLFGGDADPRL